MNKKKVIIVLKSLVTKTKKGRKGPTECVRERDVISPVDQQTIHLRRMTIAWMETENMSIWCFIQSETGQRR